MENGRDSPASTRLDVENAVRASFTSECQPLIEGIESEFLGDNTWEAGAEFRFSPVPVPPVSASQPAVEVPMLVAVFRVFDDTLTVQPLNWVAQKHVCIR